MTCKSKDNRFNKRSAFTLIELMFVIAIIAVLASLAYGVMAEAQVDAQVSATKSRIAQIESIMQVVMEDYEVRRLPVRNAELLAFVRANQITGGTDPVPEVVQLKNLRRRIMLDLIKAEFPTAYVDSSFQLVPNPDMGVFPTNQPVLASTTFMDSAPFNQSFRSWLSNAYPNGNLANFLANRQTAEVLFWQNFAASLPNPAPDPAKTFSDPGEYLFVQLSRINIDGSTALELLGPNAVGDPDDDGHPDIVDAFGESMGLKIFQAAPNAMLTDVSNDSWAFGETNWKQRTPPEIAGRGINPAGYQIASSIVPSPISTIRIQVVSPRLEERGEQ
jgi:prepilin-type N-terminal cleavage/methylation domain-containing protein